jgi:integration host factor subunit alpha
MAFKNCALISSMKIRPSCDASMPLAISTSFETVKLSSFGSFMVRKKGQRIGRNPKTGTEVPISPRRVMVFKPSTILKQRINGHHQQANGGEEAND